MKRQVKFVFCCIAAVFFIPFMITLILSGVGLEKDKIGLALTSRLTGNDGKSAVMVSYSIGSENMDMEEYVAGMLAPAYDYCDNIEFLKTMAVMCRTYMTYCNENNKKNEAVFCSDVQLKERWGDEWESKKAAITVAVEQTKGVVITCDGSVIYPYSHMLTSGYTRNIREGCKYLCEVEQMQDSTQEEYVSVVDFTDKETAALLNNGLEGLYFDEKYAANQLQIVDKTTGGYIVLIQVGNMVIDGDTFAQILGLASPSFTYKEITDGIRFTVKGQGNGYGLSIAGARQKAVAGESYQEILNYYFENIICIK